MNSKHLSIMFNRKTMYKTLLINPRKTSRKKGKANIKKGLPLAYPRAVRNNRKPRGLTEILTLIISYPALFDWFTTVIPHRSEGEIQLSARDRSSFYGSPKDFFFFPLVSGGIRCFGSRSDESQSFFILFFYFVRTVVDRCEKSRIRRSGRLFC